MGRLPKRLLFLFTLGGLGFLGLSAFVRHSEIRTAQITRSHPPQDTELTGIANVSVFDGQELLRDRDVLLRGANIVSVTEAGSQPLPAEALRIDGNGKTLLPGLIDSHAHLLTAGAPPWGRFLPRTDANTRAMLYAGVTSVLVAQSGAEEDQLIKNGRDRARSRATSVSQRPRTDRAGRPPHPICAGTDSVAI